MNTIHIIIAVDTEGALSSGSLVANVYMVDTNQYLGSWQEGQSTLNTVCQDGQALKWWAVPINASGSVVISSFSGQVIDSKICTPKLDILSGEGAWAGQVESQGSFGSFAYTVVLTLGSTNMTFNAYLKVA